MSNKPNTDKFIKISQSVFDKKLKPRDFAVYCCLVMHSDDQGYCFPSRKRIADKCRIDCKTVDVAIETLVDLGLIEKSNRYIDGRKTSNKYRVLNFDK